MALSYDIREKYRRLYERLKARIMDVLEKARIPRSVRLKIIEIVSNLPHPQVASLRDIEEAAS